MSGIPKIQNSFVGRKIFRLTVLEELEERDKFGGIRCLCKCDCGNKVIVLKTYLNRKRSKSCGCYRQEINAERLTKHGKAKVRTPIYSVWLAMKDRCANPNNPNFYNYGGRGIEVCQEWRDYFSSFERWAIESGYEDGLSIDRIEVNGNYEPANCRWITMAEQQLNRRNNNLLTLEGETKPLSQWAREHGLKIGTVLNRYARGKRGWDLLVPVERGKGG